MRGKQSNSVTGSERYDPKEIVLMMADYNGWTDGREEEREALDQLEMTPTAAAALKSRHLPRRVRGLLVHAAVREILARSPA
jgi:hypothetical protein